MRRERPKNSLNRASFKRHVLRPCATLTRVTKPTPYPAAPPTTVVETATHPLPLKRIRSSPNPSSHARDPTMIPFGTQCVRRNHTGVHPAHRTPRASGPTLTAAPASRSRSWAPPNTLGWSGSRQRHQRLDLRGQPGLRRRATGRTIGTHVYRKQRSLTKTAPSPHRERCNGTALVHRRPATPLDAGFPSPFPLFSPHHTTLCTYDLPKHPKVNLNSSSSLREDPKNGCRRCRCTVGVHHGPVDTAGSRSLPLLSPFLLLLYNIYIYKLPKHLKVSPCL